jgi:hypothetical protein
MRARVVLKYLTDTVLSKPSSAMLARTLLLYQRAQHGREDMALSLETGVQHPCLFIDVVIILQRIQQYLSAGLE